MSTIDIARRAVEIARVLSAPLRRTMLTAVTASDSTLHLLDCLPSTVNALRDHDLVEQDATLLTDLGRMVYAVLMHGAETVLAIAEAHDRGDTLPLPDEQVLTSLFPRQGDGDSQHTVAVAGNSDRNALSSSNDGGSVSTGNAIVYPPAAVHEDMVHRGVQELRARVTEQLGDVSLDWYDITAATLRAALADRTVNNNDSDTGSDIGDDRHGLRKSR